MVQAVQNGGRVASLSGLAGSAEAQPSSRSGLMHSAVAPSPRREFQAAAPAEVPPGGAAHGRDDVGMTGGLALGQHELASSPTACEAAGAGGSKTVRFSL